jgi:hypothetical protein
VVVLCVSGAGLAAFGPVSVNHGPALFLAGLWALAGAGALLLGGAGVWLAMLLALWLEEKFASRKPGEERADEPEHDSSVPLRERKIFAPRAAPVSARMATAIADAPVASARVAAASPVSRLSSSATSAASAESLPPSAGVSPVLGPTAAAPAYPHAWWPHPRPHSLPLTVAASVLVLVAVYLTAIAFAPLVGGQALLALVPVTVVAAVVLVLAHIFGNHRGVPAAALVASLAGLFIAAANLWLLDALSEAARREADRSNARIEQRNDDTAKAIREELGATASTPTPAAQSPAPNRVAVFGSPSAAWAQLRVETLTDRPNSSGWIGHVYIDTDGKQGAEKAIKILNTRSWQLLESSGRPGHYDRQIASGLIDTNGDFRGLPQNTFDGSKKVWAAGSIKATRNGVPIPAHY